MFCRFRGYGKDSIISGVMKRNEIPQCVVWGVVALIAGGVCHRYCPGLGLVLMPMFWPLAFLATRVSPARAVATAAVVPLVSALLTGMPAFPLVVTAKFALLVALAAFAWRLYRQLRRR